jgi:phosphate-selective porin OprO and OprP
MKHAPALTALAVTLSAAFAPVHAASPTLQQQIETLQQALSAQQAQLEAQKQQMDAQRDQLDALQKQLRVQSEAAAAAAAAGSAAQIEELSKAAQRQKLATQDAPRVSMTGARPTITSADGSSSLAVRAIVQMDTAHYAQDSAKALASDFRRGSVGGAGNRETNGARDLSDGTYSRRARFGVEGALARDFGYRLILELGGSGTEGPTRINDAFVSYSGFAPFTIQFGAFSPPANMDDGTSPEDALFIERASSAELSRTLAGGDGRIGLGVRGSGTRWMSALTLTTRTFADAEVFDSQAAAVGRVGLLVARSDDYTVHLGASGTYVISPADLGSDSAPPQRAIRFRERPEIRVDSTRLIDTGSIDARHAYAAGVEFGANWKSLFLQGENYWYGIERRLPTTLPDPKFSGYYVEGSWVLSGETRRYNVASGSFQNPRPFVPFAHGGGYGAWELAVRYSRTDLNYRAGDPGSAPPTGGVRGGDQAILSLGLNWYVNANLKFLLNWMRVDVDRLNPAGPGNLTPFGTAPATPPLGVAIGQDLHIYALRSQFSF